MRPVGGRTRDVVGGFKPKDWEGTVAADASSARPVRRFRLRTEQIVKAFRAGRARRC